jgi:hypothetical protein
MRPAQVADRDVKDQFQRFERGAKRCLLDRLVAKHAVNSEGLGRSCRETLPFR